MALGPVREVTAGDDQLGLDPLDEGSQPGLDRGVRPGSEMQVGDVENAGGHDRGRL